jgi:hypothetical protein
MMRKGVQEFEEFKEFWRGAALWHCSSIGLQRAAPGNVSRCGSTMGRCVPRTELTRWAKIALGSSREPPANNR